MNAECQEIEVPRGGKRDGAGRKALPEDEKRVNSTVKMLPATSLALTHLADKANTSKGRLIEWFALSPEAKEARKLCQACARKFDATK